MTYARDVILNAPDIPQQRALETIESWREQALELVQAGCSYAEAAAQADMEPLERRALHALFASHIREIERVCQQQAETIGDRALETDDLISEAYVVFQSLLVQYNPSRGSLSTYVAASMPDRLADAYKTSRRRQDKHADMEGALSEGEAEPADRFLQSLLPTEIDIDHIAERIIEEAPAIQHARLRHVWERLTRPERR
jgi:hypothetical protein